IEGFKRTHTCGELRREQVGSEVTLVGWVQDHRDLGGLLFVVLRDRYGATQCVFDPDDDAAMFERAAQLRSEWVVGIRGVVRDRGANANESQATGAVEVVAKE